MRCPFCSTENDSTRTTCIACGSPLQIPQPSVNGGSAAKPAPSAAQPAPSATQPAPSVATPNAQGETHSATPVTQEKKQEMTSTPQDIPEPTVYAATPEASQTTAPEAPQIPSPASPQTTTDQSQTPSSKPPETTTSEKASPQPTIQKESQSGPMNSSQNRDSNTNKQTIPEPTVPVATSQPAVQKESKPEASPGKPVQNSTPEAKSENKSVSSNSQTEDSKDTSSASIPIQHDEKDTEKEVTLQSNVSAAGNVTLSQQTSDQKTSSTQSPPLSVSQDGPSAQSAVSVTPQVSSSEPSTPTPTPADSTPANTPSTSLSTEAPESTSVEQSQPATQPMPTPVEQQPTQPISTPVEQPQPATQSVPIQSTPTLEPESSQPTAIPEVLQIDHSEPAMPGIQQENLDLIDDEGRTGKKIGIIVISILGAALLFGASWYGYKIISSNISDNKVVDDTTHDDGGGDVVTVIPEVSALKAEVEEGTGTIQLTWEKPQGEDQILGYSIKVNENGSEVASYSVQSSKTSYSIEGLSGDSTYSIVVYTQMNTGDISEGVSVSVEIPVLEVLPSDDETRLEDIEELKTILAHYYEEQDMYPKANNYASLLNVLISKKLLSRFIQDPAYPEQEYSYTVSSNGQSYTLKIYFDRAEFIDIADGEIDGSYYLITVNASERDLDNAVDDNTDSDGNGNSEEGMVDESSNSDEKLDDNTDYTADDNNDLDSEHTNNNDLIGEDYIKTVNISTNPDPAEVGVDETVVFSIDDLDPFQKSEVFWVLDEDNGVEGKGDTIRYKYTEPGNYRVQATVTYDDGSEYYGETMVVVKG